MKQGAAFRGLPVLVTGHTGFKGSWLAIWLKQMEAKVSGFSLDPPTTPSNYELSRVGELLEHDLRGDVCDAQAVEAAVRLVQPAVVFHLAAQPLVRKSYEIATRTFDVNVMGSLHVLEAVRRLGRRCAVIMVTSDKCYQNREHVWGYRECDPMGGEDPYSASKAAAELVVASFRSSFFDPKKLGEHKVSVASVRAGNVIGGGDWAEDRIVPDCVRALAAGKPLQLRNPGAIRPWQHVLDPLSGYLELAGRMVANDDPELCSGWNFGPMPQSAVPVGSLVELMIRHWGAGSWEDHSKESNRKEAWVLRLSIDKAVHVLGWQPRWSIEHAIEKTVGWYKQSLQPGANMIERCRAEIDEFQSKENAAV